MALDPTKDPNYQFLQRLSPDKPIKILLSPKSSGSDLVSKSDIEGTNYGIFKPKRRKKIRRPPTRKKGIRFFDCGYAKIDGVWTTLFHLVNPPYDSVDESFITFPDPTLTDYEASDDNVFDFPMSSWASTFRKAEGSNVYTRQLQIGYEGVNGTLNNDANWSGDTLTLDEDDVDDTFLITMLSNPDGDALYGPLNGTATINIFNTNPASDNAKITATRDFDDDPVTIPVSRQFDVYIMPGFRESLGQSSATMGVDTVGPESANWFAKCYLNYFHYIMDRGIFFDPEHPFYETVISGNGGWASTLDAYTDAYNASLYAESITGSRATSITYGELRSTAYGSDWKLGDFPAPPGQPTGSLPYPTSGQLVITDVSHGRTLSGILLYVIVMGPDTYYVWRD